MPKNSLQQFWAKSNRLMQRACLCTNVLYSDTSIDAACCDQLRLCDATCCNLRQLALLCITLDTVSLILLSHRYPPRESDILLGHGKKPVEFFRAHLKGGRGLLEHGNPPNHMSHNQNPVLKWTQTHVKNFQGGRSHLWLTNLHLPVYPGFHCGSYRDRQRH